METTIMPCPICGEEPELAHTRINDKGRSEFDYLHYVLCSGCGISTDPWEATPIRFGTEQEMKDAAIIAWNKMCVSVKEELEKRYESRTSEKA